MTDLEAASNRLSFDDILEAVQDSRRGRWFLQEYENRLQQRDSKSILSAIGRLESRMEALGSAGAGPEELNRVRSAIANARQDLMKMGLGEAALSKEGRMFAELAEMARKAMPNAAERLGGSNVDASAGIVRSLQLVDEIDRTITQATVSAASTPAAGIDRGAQYFAADSALFERPAPPARPALVPDVEPKAAAAAVASPAVAAAASITTVAPPKPAPEPVATGAKLVFKRLPPGQEADQLPVAAPAAVEAQQVAEASARPDITPAAEETPAAPPAPAIAEVEQVQASGVETPRIVIIRRKPEDMPEVDVAEPESESTAA